MIKRQRILVTGADGFIGKNLVISLAENAKFEVIPYVRGDTIEKLALLVAKVDVIIHLAGVNRTDIVDDFVRVNIGLTQFLCEEIRATGRNIPLLLSSSTQAGKDNPYGKSKLAAEKVVEEYVIRTGNTAIIYRLPGVFGKWCKPNYNSVVATYCHNIARNLPIKISNVDSLLELVYIDDVIEEFRRAMGDLKPGLVRGEILPKYSISLGNLAEQISAFQNCRTNLITERVGKGLTRALYSTYISYLPTDLFFYDLPQHGDERGIFVEMLKTKDSGQFSFFTVYPGITRGSHYHHSKTEKFLVVKGVAMMRFRHLITGETYQITASADKPQVVESIPGWVHDITNIGVDDAIIMLWANEIFDRQRPDCLPCKV